jgi:hypothetical protein
MFPRKPWIPLAALAAVAACLPAAPAVAASSCATLPLTAARPTADPVDFQDGSTMTLRARGVKVKGIAVTLQQAGLTYAHGAVAAAAPGASVSVPLIFTKGIVDGPFTVVVTGTRQGCTSPGRVKAHWRFSKLTLPIVASRPSAYAEDYGTKMKIALRSVGGRSIRNVTAELVAGNGAVVGKGTRTGSFTQNADVTLSLTTKLTSGSYRLRVVGRTAYVSQRLVRTEPLAFRSAQGATQLGGATAVTTSSPDAGLVSQRATVDWGSGAHEGRDTAGFQVPGIGYGEVVCRPNAQWLRLFSGATGHEIAMMNWVHKDWVQFQENALREGVLTQFTGTQVNEGFNKFSPAEKLSTGTFQGIISDRGLFGSAGGPGTAPTTISLAWSWDFTTQGDERCAVDATFTTEKATSATPPIARSLSLNWRGDDNAAGHDGASVDVPGLGRVDATCAAGVNGTRWVTITGPGGATVTTRQGSDETVVPVGTGPVAVPLPNNGMLQFAFPGGGTLLMSSRWKVNDPKPAQNYCFLAAQAVQP